jgi:hypothetical protein
MGHPPKISPPGLATWATRPYYRAVDQVHNCISEVAPPITVHSAAARIGRFDGWD